MVDKREAMPALWHSWRRRRPGPFGRRYVVEGGDRYDDRRLRGAAIQTRLVRGAVGAPTIASLTTATFFRRLTPSLSPHKWPFVWLHDLPA